MSEIPAPATIEANMAYNLHKTGRHKFAIDGVEHEVDTESVASALYRMNAMTIYEDVYSWLMVAKNMSSYDILFYLVKIKPGTGYPRWMKITPEFAETQFYF